MRRATSGEQAVKRGAWGEQLAREFLEKQGYYVVTSNYRTRFGEVDIIVQTDAYIIFAEVKTRRNADFAAAREHVTIAKQRRIIAAAQEWLQQNACTLQPRFDVIEVYGVQGDTAPYQINHLENAFGG